MTYPPDRRFVLNRRHPLARDIAFCFLPIQGIWTDLVRNKPFLTLDNSSGDLTPEIGRFGVATRFSGDATNDRIDLGSITSADKVSLASETAMTVAFSANIATLGGQNFGRVIDKSDGGSAANGWSIFALVEDGVRDLTFRINNAVGGNLIATNIITFNETHSYCCTRTGTGTNQADWYKDGLVYITGTLSAAFPTTTTNAAIGNWNHSTDRMTDGVIDYVMGWTRALSPQEEFQRTQDPFQMLHDPSEDDEPYATAPVVVGGRIMSSLVAAGGLAGKGGLAGQGGGLAG